MMTIRVDLVVLVMMVQVMVTQAGLIVILQMTTRQGSGRRTQQ